MSIKDKVTVAQVRTTSDYSQFRPLAFNRSVSRKHLGELTRSFEAHPEMISASPLIVNKSMEVVDGQHRLEVLKALGLPVYYIVVENANILSAQVLNVVQKGWNLLDYAKSYAASGNPHYQRFLTLLEDYPMAASALIAVVLNRGAGGQLTRLFKRGSLEIPEDAHEIYERLEWLLSFKDAVTGWGRRELTIALYHLYKTDGFDQDHMLAVLAADKLPLLGSYQNYLEELEKRYNRSSSAADYLRFT